MSTPDKIQDLLKSLPKVDILADMLSPGASRKMRVAAARNAIDTLRKKILSGKPGSMSGSDFSMENMKRLGMEELDMLMSYSLISLVNATGVVIHTNLGRSPLPDDVLVRMTEVARGYSNLEYDLKNGRRGSRYSHVEDILCELTGAESALVVNNNAAAVLISLETLAKGNEVVVSRGELVEIGGSFRIPDVMARSGAILKEVGATNRTHLHDYEQAITEQTALLLKVHQSNFAITGFTSSVPISELKALAARYGLHVMEDLGSGTFTDFARYGMIHEPTVQEAVSSGADIVTFSGDKLLGGPQAGIIVGRKHIIDRIKKNPLNRALRIDKLTLAALEGILHIYRDPEQAVKDIPVLKMLTVSEEELEAKADRLLECLSDSENRAVILEKDRTVSRVGGGALPLQELVSFAVTITVKEDSRISASAIEKKLRNNDPPVIVRIEDDAVLLDVRTIMESEFETVRDALKKALKDL